MTYNITRYIIGYTAKDDSGQDAFYVFNARPQSNSVAILDAQEATVTSLSDEKAKIYTKEEADTVIDCLQYYLYNCKDRPIRVKDKDFELLTQEQFDGLRNAEVFPITIQASINPPAQN